MRTREEQLKIMFYEEYDKGARKPNVLNSNINDYLYWLNDYMLRKILFDSVRVKVVTHYDNTYNISFTDKNNGYKTKFYNVPRNLCNFVQLKTED